MFLALSVEASARFWVFSGGRDEDYVYAIYAPSLAWAVFHSAVDFTSRALPGCL